MTLNDARAIAKEAYIYGFPLVDDYRVSYSYFVDGSSPEFKAPWNALSNTARVYTPDDKAIQTPNSDTPYSQLGTDLRAEPLVLTIPPIETDRYFSVQLIDAYTHNFAYIGSRTTGSGGGYFMLAGPRWKGETPKGIAAVFRSETELGGVLSHPAFRTRGPRQPEGRAGRLQGSDVVGVSGRTAPAGCKQGRLRRALDRGGAARASPEFFNVLCFVLTFCPTHPSETALRERFARLGIAGGKSSQPRRPSARDPAGGKGQPRLGRRMGGVRRPQGQADRHFQGHERGRVRDAGVSEEQLPLSDGRSRTGHLRQLERGGDVSDLLRRQRRREARRISKCLCLALRAGRLPPVHSFWSLTSTSSRRACCTPIH